VDCKDNGLYERGFPKKLNRITALERSVATSAQSGNQTLMNQKNSLFSQKHRNIASESG
jgi:hypothetical protein